MDSAEPPSKSQPDSDIRVMGNPPPQSMPATYLEDVVRLARILCDRISSPEHAGIHDQVTPDGLVTQLILRSGSISPSTWRKEKSALVSFFRHAMDGSARVGLIDMLSSIASRKTGVGKSRRKTGKQGSAAGRLILLCSGSQDALDKSCQAALDRIVATSIDAASSHAHHEAVRLAAVTAGHPDAVDLEAIQAAQHQLAGTERSRSGRKRTSDSFQPVTAADMHHLCQTIMASRARAGRETDPACLMDGSIDGRTVLVAATLFQASWYTGLRPIEWYEASVIAGPPDDIRQVEDWLPDLAEAEIRSMRFTPADHDGADRNLVRRHLVDHCIPILFGDKALTDGSELPGRSTPIPHTVVLVVKNAKHARTEAAADDEAAGLPSVRLLDLSPLPFAVRRSIFYLTFLRHLPEERRPSFERNLRGIVARASEKAFPGRRRISLYDARHDFADRIRGIYSRAEAMALMGHVSVASLSHYGRKHRRQGSGGRGGAMLPRPDPGIVATIRQHLEAKGLADTPPVDFPPAPDSLIDARNA